MVKFVAACTLALAFAVLPARAGAQPQTQPTTGAAPLRHLVFSLALEITYTSEFGGLRAISDPSGSGTVQTKRGQTVTGQIVCDVVAVNRQTGDLLLDVTEEAAERNNATVRIVLHLDGTLAYLPNQRTLTEEELMLVPLLARGYVGSEVLQPGATWNVETKDERYTGKTTFHVSTTRLPDDETFTFDEEFRYSGANGYSGTAHGLVNYNPGKLVPRRLEVLMNTRFQQLGHDTFMKYQMNYSLKEDSFGTR